MANEGYAQAIEMIAATVAHEVKNPLAMIQVNLDYIELCDTEKKYEKNYRIIRKELNKTNEMLVNFIHLMHPTSKSDGNINAWELVEQVATRFEKTYGTNITFEKGWVEEELSFLGNEDLFEMVITNIFKNAIESMNSGGVLQMRIVEEAPWLVMEFIDSGCGLARDIINKINNRETYTTKQQGSGLGIHICRQVVEAHNGHYTIENHAGGGCLVRVLLPLYVRETPALSLV